MMGVKQPHKQHNKADANNEFDRKKRGFNS